MRADEGEDDDEGDGRRRPAGHRHGLPAAAAGGIPTTTGAAAVAAVFSLLRTAVLAAAAPFPLAYNGCWFCRSCFWGNGALSVGCPDAGDIGVCPTKQCAAGRDGVSAGREDPHQERN